MALMITDTTGGLSQRLRCAAGRGARMHACSVFVVVEVSPWP